MQVNPGKYFGTGVFRLDREKSSHKIECVVEITIHPSEYLIQGYWQNYSRKEKHEFNISINKFAASKIENVLIDYPGHKLIGGLNSIDEYSTGAFTNKENAAILGVTVLTTESGYRCSGTLLSKQKAMFDIKLLSSDPKLANSNVVEIVGKSA